MRCFQVLPVAITFFCLRHHTTFYVFWFRSLSRIVIDASLITCTAFGWHGFHVHQYLLNERTVPVYVLSSLVLLALEGGGHIHHHCRISYSPCTHKEYFTNAWGKENSLAFVIYLHKIFDIYIYIILPLFI